MTIPVRQLHLLLGLLGAGSPFAASASWSIVACDPDGSCGVAASGASALGGDWEGTRDGEGFSVQGNGLHGPQVLDAMRARYLASGGPLALRLIGALEAGQAAGGPCIGAMSAALLVRAPAGGCADVDLRVGASLDPVRDLHVLLDRRQAHETMLRAERLQRGGDSAAAARQVTDALALGPDWDRLWRRAARLAMQQGDCALAFERLGVLHRLNPMWAREELRDPMYATVSSDAQVAGWR